METREAHTKWLIDPTKSTISFKVDPKIFASVEGTFRIFDLQVEGNANDFSSAKIQLRIDASSITTGDMERDEHLRSMDFFDVKQFSEITFSSTDVKLLSNTGIYQLSGNLTIKGITKEVLVKVQEAEDLVDAEGLESIVFIISGKVHRQDWGLVWNESPDTGGLMESEEVDISCNITLTDKR